MFFAVVFCCPVAAHNKTACRPSCEGASVNLTNPTTPRHDNSVVIDPLDGARASCSDESDFGASFTFQSGALDQFKGSSPSDVVVAAWDDTTGSKGWSFDVTKEIGPLPASRPGGSAHPGSAQRRFRPRRFRPRRFHPRRFHGPRRRRPRPAASRSRRSSTTRRRASQAPSTSTSSAPPVGHSIVRSRFPDPGSVTIDDIAGRRTMRGRRDRQERRARRLPVARPVTQDVRAARPAAIGVRSDRSRQLTNPLIEVQGDRRPRGPEEVNNRSRSSTASRRSRWVTPSRTRSTTWSTGRPRPATRDHRSDGSCPMASPT